MTNKKEDYALAIAFGKIENIAKSPLLENDEKVEKIKEVLEQSGEVILQ
jgi:hypothetical protein